MDCTVCGKEMKSGDTGFELNKGTYDEGIDGVLLEHSAGVYHEACFPSNVPVEPEPEEVG